MNNDIIENGHNENDELAENENYPKAKVILCYCLFGGAMGGFFLGLLWIFTRFRGVILLEKLSFVFVSMLFGSVLGLLPALFTALILVFRKFYIKSVIDYLYLAILGFIVTAITGITFFVPWYVIATVGAISTVILGKFVLPKKDVSHET